MFRSHNLDIELQRRYYSETAKHYDDIHSHDDDEHIFALRVMLGLFDYLGVKSILDVGSGTGNILIIAKHDCPDLRIIGVEPVLEMREVAYSKGIAREELIEGNIMDICFNDCSFDLVCSFGVLHHIKNPRAGVSEMLRVAKKAIFISDCNNFGQGSRFTRLVKQALNGFGLWPLVDFIRTKGRGYTISEGDGLTYSYSIFNNYRQIKKACRSVHLFNTSDASMNLYRSASHIALLGVK